jgi:hypothetical protein
MILLSKAELIVKLNTSAIGFGQIITLIKVSARFNQIVLRDKARKNLNGIHFNEWNVVNFKDLIPLSRCAVHL